MRCANCSLPLSPARTHCPVCGAANPEKVGKQNDHSSNKGEVPQYAFPVQQDAHSFSPPQANDNGQPSYSSTWQGQQTPSQQVPFYQSADPSPSFQNAGQQGHIRLAGGDSLSAYPSAQQPANQLGPASVTQANSWQPPQKPQQTQHKGSARLNFTIAGFCILMGSLILVFVYIISFTLPPAPVSHQPRATATMTSRGVSPIVQGSTQNVTATVQATPTVTPTVNLLGQQYIDTARMASAVNTTTAQPTQPTNVFRVRQPIFVTFMLHPKDNGGAVCLLWYLNQKPFSHYSFAVDPTTQSAYSYAYAGDAGAGSVEIYWASTTACEDKSLAQVVNFTVNP